MTEQEHGRGVLAVDYDAGLPPIYSGRVSAVADVLIDGRQWVRIAPGDRLADRMAFIDHGEVDGWPNLG